MKLKQPIKLYDHNKANIPKIKELIEELYPKVETTQNQ